MTTSTILWPSEVTRIEQELEAAGFTALRGARMQDCFVRYGMQLNYDEELLFLMRDESAALGASHVRITFKLHVAADDYWGQQEWRAPRADALDIARAALKEAPQALAMLRAYYADWRAAMDVADACEGRPRARGRAALPGERALLSPAYEPCRLDLTRAQRPRCPRDGGTN